MLRLSKPRKRLSAKEAEAVIQYARVANSVFENADPFDYQKKVYEDIFVDKKRYVFCLWPRGAGKTEVARNCMILKAITEPRSIIFYITSTQKQAELIIWDRLKEAIPKSYLKQGGIKESTKKIYFSNGSVVHLFGSEADKDAYIGSEPSFVIYDEFRLHDKKFHDVMSPAYRKPGFQLLIISTPPDLVEIESGKRANFKYLMENCKKDADKSFYKITCWEANPLLQEFYKQQEEEFSALKRENEFKREMLCEFIRGTKDSYFPEFTYDDLVPHQDLMRMLPQESLNRWVIGADTSGGDRWGVLFCYLDVRKKSIYILDCITKRSVGGDFEDRDNIGMSGYKLWPSMLSKMKELNPGSSHDDWIIIWDCQDIPIMDEIHRWYGSDINLCPVNKKKMAKGECLNLIRDLKLLGRIYIGSRAKELVDEFQSAELNPKTRLPNKEYDELMDCFRYVIYENEDMFDLNLPLESKYKGLTEEQIHLKKIEEMPLEKDDFFDGIDISDNFLW